MPADLSNSTLQQVVTGTVMPLTELVNLGFQNPNPALSFYYANAAVYELVDANGNATLNALPLDTTLAPSPVQIGAFSEPAASLCYGDFHSGYTNIFIPSTAYFLLQYAPSGGSCTSPSTALANYVDAPGTPPADVVGSGVTYANPSANYADLYNFPSGDLYAVVLLTKPYGGDLGIYFPTHNNATLLPPNFASPTAVAPSVASVVHYPIFLNRLGQASSTVLFDNVVLTGGNGNFLYRIDTNGNVTQVGAAASATATTYSGALTVGAFDNTNVYFVDVVASIDGTVGQLYPGPPVIYNFYEAPISCDGTVPNCGATLIGTVTEPQSGEPLTGTPGIAYGSAFAIVDSDGTNLLIESTNLTTGEGNFTFQLYKLPVGPPFSGTTNPTAFTTPYQGKGLTAFLDYASDYLFIDETDGSGNITSLALPPSGTVPPWAAATIDSSFVQWLPAITGGPNNSTVLQLTGVFADGTDSNVVINNINLASGTGPTPFQQGGINYSVPQGDILTLGAVSNTIGQGTLLAPSGLNNGFAINVYNGQLISILPPSGTALAPFNFFILAPYNNTLFPL